MNRRSFIRGLFAAPAIVAVGNIMPVRAIDRLVAPLAFDAIAVSPTLELGDTLTLNNVIYRITEVYTSHVGRVEYLAGVRRLEASSFLKCQQTPHGRVMARAFNKHSSILNQP